MAEFEFVQVKKTCDNKLKVVMPWCACASKAYGNVFVCV